MCMHAYKCLCIYMYVYIYIYIYICIYVYMYVRLEGLIDTDGSNEKDIQTEPAPGNLSP